MRYAVVCDIITDTALTLFGPGARQRAVFRCIGSGIDPRRFVGRNGAFSFIGGQKNGQLSAVCVFATVSAHVKLAVPNHIGKIVKPCLGICLCGFVIVRIQANGHKIIVKRVVIRINIKFGHIKRIEGTDVCKMVLVTLLIRQGLGIKTNTIHRCAHIAEQNEIIVLGFGLQVRRDFAGRGTHSACQADRLDGGAIMQELIIEVRVALG